MDSETFFEERIVFNPHTPAATNKLLQEAVAVTSSNVTQAEKLFLQAQTSDCHCLQTYFALYKFYFFHKRLGEAEHYALQGLEEAARQGGFPSDYRRLAREPEKWDLYANDIGLFYLYCLKALAFIKLRSESFVESDMILTQLKQLDPQDLSGASVVMDIAAEIIN